MRKVIGCKSSYWYEQYLHWSDVKYRELQNSFCRCIRMAEQAKEETKQSGCGSIDFSVSITQVDEMFEVSEQLARFAQYIEEEIEEEVEAPFYRQMLGTLKLAYSLNPREIMLTPDEYIPGVDLRMLQMTLHDFTEGCPLDDKLRDSFQKAEAELNTDEPTKSFRKEIKKTWQWLEKIPYEDIKEIDRILYKGMMGVDLWNARKVHGSNGPAELANAADVFYDYAPYWVFKNASTGTASAYYTRSESGVYYDIDIDRTNVRNPYTTFFHEFGHMLDNSATEKNRGIDIRKTTSEYYSCNYSKYSKEFYNNLIADVWNYINHYDLSKTRDPGTGKPYSSKDDAIRYELSGRKNNEISDLYGAVTNNCIVGNYKHTYRNVYSRDKKVVQENYWGYSVEPGIATTEKPDIEPLTVEAFAHFTEITIMQDPVDLKNLQKYFPTAYATYVKMIGEITSNEKKDKKGK